MPMPLKFQFRWKYAISAFLVCGVLSLTIGGPKAPDPLLVETKALAANVERAFKINKGPNATDAELDGPSERTLLENSPALIELVQKTYALGRKISSESFRRGLDSRNTVSGDAIRAVSESAKLYMGIQLRFYKNYMRLAHDANFKTYKTENMARTVLGQLVGTPRGELERWLELNKDAIAANGARSFSPNHYDFLNIRVDKQIAQNLFTDENANRAYNLRHVKDVEGRFSGVELFINAFEKQMAEYDAIAEPKSKEEYMKLIQFAALREGMANRWAIRRMAGASIREEKIPRGMYEPRPLPKMKKNATMTDMLYSMKAQDVRYVPISFSDETIHSCAPDLVSFRLSKGGNVNDIEAYSAQWQADRHTDMMQLAADPAIASTVGKPLLTDAEYAELFAIYVSEFDSFRKGALLNYQGDTDGMLADMALAFSPPIRGAEESKWSRDRIQGHENSTSPDADRLVLAREAFFYASFPADDLSIKGVSERYADRAFELRKFYLAEALWGVANQHRMEVSMGPTSMYDDPVTTTKTVSVFPETNAPAAKRRAVLVVEDFLRTREKAWKEKLASGISRAIETKLGLAIPTAKGNPAGLGYLFGQDQKRYDAYASDLMPIAAIGARGVQVRRAAEKITKKLEEDVKRLKYCPPLDRNETIMSVKAGYPNASKSCYYRFPEAKNAKDPKEYLGYAPYRLLAREQGMKDIILPETPDQLSIFFRKKLELVVSHDNEITKYVEPGIAEKIANHAVVMRGIDRFFGALAQAVEKAPGGSVGDEATLVGVDRLKGKRRGRNPANAEVESRRNKLEAVIIPTAKTAYQDFIKGLTDPGSYVDPVRAAKKREEIKKENAARINEERKQNQTIVRDNLSIPKAKLPPELNKASEKDRKEIKAKLEHVQSFEKKKLANGYFRRGKDRSMEMKGGEFYLPTEKERAEAKKLYREALAMLGIAEEATAGVSGETAKWGFSKAASPYPPNQVSYWVTTEHLIHQILPRTRLLERMVATVSDQLAMGKVLAQEAISRAPILTLQSNWKWKKDEKQDPILLEKLAGAYNSANGWGDGAGYQYHFKQTLSNAALNDRGKVETFCKASVKSYRTDDDFRTMFMAVSGIRGMLSTDSKIQAWDAIIQKESRSWGQAFMEDYIDPNMTLLMIAILVVVLAQVAFTIGTGGAGAVTAPAAAAEIAALAGVSSTTAATAAAVAAETIGTRFLAGIAKFIFLQFTGNFGAISLIFSFQSYLMISTYHFKMPPQMGFTYQLANSRIQSMKEGRFAGGSVVERERMNQAREELKGQQTMAIVAGVGELAAFGIFTAPGVLRTVGLHGQKVFARAAASSPELAETVGTKSLPQLIKEKGLRKGMAEYWEKAGVALRAMDRVAVVKGTESGKETLELMLGNRLSHELLKDRATLKKFYQMMRNEKLTEAKRLLGVSDEKLLKAAAKQLADTPLINFQAIQQQVDEAVAPIVRKALAEGHDEAMVVVWKQDYEKQLFAAKVDELSRPGRSQRRLEAEALAKRAKAQTAMSDVAVLDKYLENLEKLPPVAGKPENADFIASWSTSDFELHRSFFEKKAFFFEKNTYDLFDKATRKGIRKAYKDFAYLTEDWSRAKNARAAAIGRAFREGTTDLYINSSTGEFDKIYAKDLEENPEDYVVNTISVPRPKKKP